MEQRNSAAWGYQVYRYAVGDGHGEEDSRRGSAPAIYPLDLNPPAPGVQTHHFDPMHLVTQRNGREFG
jgi:hypothetical protein